MYIYAYKHVILYFLCLIIFSSTCIYLLNFFKKYQYIIEAHLNKPIVNLFDNHLNDIIYTSDIENLFAFKLFNISHQNIKKSFKNQLIYDVIDLKYSLNECYNENKRNLYLNKLNNLINQLNQLQVNRNLDEILLNNKTNLICAEIDLGRLYGYSRYELGIELSCKNETIYRKYFENSLTLLFDATYIKNFNNLKKFLSNITLKSYKNIKKLVAIDQSIDVAKLNTILSENTIELIKFQKTTTNNIAYIWNYLIKHHVHTQYLLIGKNINNFVLNNENYVKFERFINILSSQSNVAVVSASYLNSFNSKWYFDCYQFDFVNSSYLNRFIINNYYVESTINDALKCDYINGPFIARTNVMLNTPFDENLIFKDDSQQDILIYIDFFIKLYHLNYDINLISDAMFGVSNNLIEIDELSIENSINLAIKWNLNEIQINNKLNFDFTQHICNKNKNLDLNLCFFDSLLKLVNQLFNECKLKNLLCYLDNENFKLVKINQTKNQLKFYVITPNRYNLFYDDSFYKINFIYENDAYLNGKILFKFYINGYSFNMFEEDIIYLIK